MIELSREMIAYAIIGVVLLAMLPLAISIRRRRHHDRLRRRGIKHYGH